MQDNLQIIMAKRHKYPVDLSWAQMVKDHKVKAPGHRKRQRAGVEYAEASEASFSYLARYLLEEFAFGILSANQVQKLSMMAKLDAHNSGCTCKASKVHSSLGKLSSLGADGIHTNNIQRDLIRYIGSYMKPIVQPQPDCVVIPLKLLKDGAKLKKGTHLIPHYYLAPHKLMHFMYINFKKAFQDKVLGPDGAIEEFWSGVAADDPRLIQLAGHHPDFKRKCVPIIIHGDGVPCTNSHSLDVISFESLLAKKGMGTACSTLDYIFCITGVFTQTIDCDDQKPSHGLGKTKIQMWKFIVHTLRACYFGYWPDKDPMGNEFIKKTLNYRNRKLAIMGGYVLVPWVLKGDMDFQINHFEFPGHWQADNPCPTCPCNRVQNSPMAWNNFSPHAEWKTKWFDTSEAFTNHCSNLGKPIHQLFQPLGQEGMGMHPKSLYMDCLHVVDLGVAMHVGGNVLHLLCYHVLPHSAAANMDQMWKRISALYKDLGTTSQFPHLTLSNFCDPAKPHADFPVLKGKGAMIRHLMPILALIWREHMRADHRNDKFVARLLDDLVSFYRCLDYKDAHGNHPFHLPKLIAKQILKNCEAVQMSYVYLAEQNFKQVPPIFSWNIAPKLHYFWHLGKQASDLNPRMSWCYANEDVVGKISTIGMSCRHGQVAACRSSSLMTKYILGITLRMVHAQSS